MWYLVDSCHLVTPNGLNSNMIDLFDQPDIFFPIESLNKDVAPGPIFGILEFFGISLQYEFCVPDFCLLSVEYL